MPQQAMKPERPSLVIVTTHFGTNFSGGSTATCEIFSRLENYFEKVVVVGTELGSHPFNSLDFIKYKNWLQAVHILRQLADQNTIFYGDFYNAILCVWARVPFYFTYHDNWPEIRQFGFKNRLRALFFIPVYKQIFEKAEAVITVSKFKFNYIKNYSSEVSIIHNGFKKTVSVVKSSNYPKRKTIIMAGNIDCRKYALALKLFQLLQPKPEIRIDIYGNILDDKLAAQLSQFDFVHLKGFVSSIPYRSYSLLLHTSFSENFSIVFCEAIYNKLQVLTFDTGGASEIINNTNGKLIRPYDLESMKNSIEDLLEHPISVDNSTVKNYSWDLAAKLYHAKMIV